jgi:outer membrane protein assembly factor BamB
MRPPLRVWVWTGVTVALVLVGVLLWRGSDAAATESTTAAAPHAPSGTPAAAVSRAWSATGTQPDDVLVGGRVLVGSPHGVRALDPVTGREVWHYTRSNARLCGVTATNGVAVAFFRTADRCNEVVALDAGTGVRAWTRNANLRPDAVFTSTDRIVLAASPTGVVTFDPTGDTLRWRHKAPPGCLFLGAAVGSSGVAVLQHCPGAAATQLRLLDGFAGTSHWQRDLPAPDGTRIRLLGADQLLGVVVGDEVRLLAGTDGAQLRSLPLRPAAPALMRAAGTTALVWLDGTLTSYEDTTATPRWHVAAEGLPAGPGSGTGPAALLVPEKSGFVHRDVASGRQLRRSAVSGLPAGGVADSIGATIVYRLADRILAYR